MGEQGEYELRPKDQGPPRTRGVLEAWQALGTIQMDFPCVKCGYNLRTLRRSGQCPECGLEVAVSLGGRDGLQYADRAWLGKLALGTLWLWLAAVLYVAGVVLGALERPELWRLGLAMGGVGAVCDMLGTLYVSACEPRLAGEWGWSVRKVLRMTAALPPVVYGAGVALLLGAEVPVLFAAMAGVAALKMPPTGAVLYMLAKRIPNDTLAWRTNNLTWGLTAGLGLTALAGAPVLSGGWLAALAFAPLALVNLAGFLGVLYLLGCFFVDFYHAAQGIGAGGAGEEE